MSDRKQDSHLGRRASQMLAAVLDQEVGQHRPVVVRKELHQVLLDLHRVGLAS